MTYQLTVKCNHEQINWTSFRNRQHVQRKPSENQWILHDDTAKQFWDSHTHKLGNKYNTRSFMLRALAGSQTKRKWMKSKNMKPRTQIGPYIFLTTLIPRKKMMKEWSDRDGQSGEAGQTMSVWQTNRRTKIRLRETLMTVTGKKVSDLKVDIMEPVSEKLRNS